jgi:hypothetical protein
MHLVDGEDKPSTRYLYEAMDKEQESIKLRLKNTVTAYLPYIRVIDASGISNFTILKSNLRFQENSLLPL